MGFFDNENNKELLESYFDEQPFIIDVPKFPIGSTVLYSGYSDDFVLFPPETQLTDIANYISLGVVLEQIGPMKYIVLFKNVLNSESETILRGKSSDSVSVLAALFKDYSRRFKEKLPDVFSLIRKNVDFILPGNQQMDLIRDNKELIIKQIAQLTSQEKADSLKNKLNTSNIFCNIGGHIALWHEPTKFKKTYYEAINTFVTGYFLPIFILDLTELKR